MLFEHRKRLQKRIYLLCKHGQGFQKTVLTRGHILFTLHRVWCLLNCGLHPQNSQLLTKRTLMAFNALSLVLLKEDAWAFGCGCSLNGSMNKNLKSERKRHALKAKNLSQKSSLGWNFTTMRNKKLIYLQFSPKKT